MPLALAYFIIGGVHDDNIINLRGEKVSALAKVPRFKRHQPLQIIQCRVASGQRHQIFLNIHPLYRSSVILPL